MRQARLNVAPVPNLGRIGEGLLAGRGKSQNWPLGPGHDGSRGDCANAKSRECSGLAKIAAHDQDFPGAVWSHGIAYIGAYGEKSALFHHAVRFFIANEVIGPNCVGFKIVAGMLDKALKGLGSVAVAPVLLSINIQRNMRCRTRDTGNLHAF